MIELVVMLAATAGVLVFVLRPLFRSSWQARKEVEDAELLASRQAVLRALGELDLDHQLGRVDEEAYLQLRQAKRREGAAILRAIEETDTRPQPDYPLAGETDALSQQELHSKSGASPSSRSTSSPRGAGHRRSRVSDSRGRPLPRELRAGDWRQVAVVAMLCGATLCLLATIVLFFLTSSQGAGTQGAGTQAGDAAAALASGPAASSPTGSVGTGPGEISGHVTNGTTKAADTQGTDVFLLIQVNGSLVDQRDGKLDSHGAYQFTDLPIGSDKTYEVVVTYAGAPYTSSPITLGQSSAKQSADLDVYDSTKVDPGLKAARVALLFGTPDPAQQEISVYEFLTITNPSNRAFVPDPNAVAGPQSILRFGLPADARDVALGDGFDMSQAIQVDGGFGAFAPVPPGDHLYTFSYRVPYLFGRLAMNVPLVYGAASLQVAVPESGLALSSPDLGRAEPVTLSNSPFWLLAGQNLPAGAQPTVELSNLPAKPLVNRVLEVVRLPAVIPLLLVLGLAVGVALARRRARADGERDRPSIPQDLDQEDAPASEDLSSPSVLPRGLRWAQPTRDRPDQVGEVESG